MSRLGDLPDEPTDQTKEIAQSFYEQKEKRNNLISTGVTVTANVAVIAGVVYLVKKIWKD